VPILQPNLHEPQHVVASHVQGGVRTVDRVFAVVRFVAAVLFAPLGFVSMFHCLSAISSSPPCPPMRECTYGAKVRADLTRR
jgi:hypothetical protein